MRGIQDLLCKNRDKYGLRFAPDSPSFSGRVIRNVNKLIFVVFYEGDSECGGSGQIDAAKQMALDFVAKAPVGVDYIEDIRLLEVSKGHGLDFGGQRREGGVVGHG
jgi:hypothetical protein